MKNFKNLKIWQKGMDIVRKVYSLSKGLPIDERFNLKIQICRSAVSIPSNIAEGSAKSSRKEYKKYLEISQGSCFELETQILVIEMLSLSSEQELIKEILKDIDEEQKMLESFIKKIETNG